MARLGLIGRTKTLATGLARWSMSKSARVFAWFLVTVGGTLGTPAVLWQMRAERPLTVLIVDKTVSTTDYREHRGLHWILRHRKVVDPGTRRTIDLRDYAGYDPASDPPVRQIAARPRSLDLAYVTDTYGVYEDDLGIERPSGDKPELVYGGLRNDEIRRLLGAMRPSGTLIAEFNSLASPTRGEARVAFGEAVGVRWTGWIGRHFDELRVNPELPAWLPTTFTANTGHPWRFRGPGYVFVDEAGALVVLDEGIDAASPGVEVHFTSAAADRYRAQRRHVYDHWFDIVEPTAGAEVLATYELALRRRGKRLLAEAGIPTSFPAVVRRESPTHLSYYFAGDYADHLGVPANYRYTGLPTIRRAFQGETRDDAGSFFWKVYEPVMNEILREADVRRQRALTGSAR